VLLPNLSKKKSSNRKEMGSSKKSREELVSASYNMTSRYMHGRLYILYWLFGHFIIYYIHSCTLSNTCPVFCILGICTKFICTTILTCSLANKLWNTLDEHQLFIFISPCVYAITIHTHYKDPNCLVDILLTYCISKFVARSVASYSDSNILVHWLHGIATLELNWVPYVCLTS
jgi:hypothetical protein